MTAIFVVIIITLPKRIIVFIDPVPFRKLDESVPFLTIQHLWSFGSPAVLCLMIWHQIYGYRYMGCGHETVISSVQFPPSRCAPASCTHTTLLCFILRMHPLNKL